ncbi:MAG TPA: hypothetical protein VFU31_29880 [Candidatus Binatia bacterium]|nr:hypothetical protein [Candidatus Binatia bacterium]
MTTTNNPLRLRHPTRGRHKELLDAADRLEYFLLTNKASGDECDKYWESAGVETDVGLVIRAIRTHAVLKSQPKAQGK